MRTELTEQEWADVAACREAARAEALTGAWTVEEFRDAAAVVYAAIGQPPPLVVVAPGPQTALLWAALLGAQSQGQGDIGTQLSTQLNSQLRAQLSTQLSSQLYSQLDSQLSTRLRAQLNSQLGTQLREQLYSQLYSQLNSQLYSQLYSQLSQLSTQLDSKLAPQLSSQLVSQLWSQLNSQLGSQIAPQLVAQLSSQLYSQLGTQLSTQLGTQLNEWLDTQLREQLSSQLISQLGTQLNSQLGERLGMQLGSQLSTRLREQLREQLGEQLWAKLDEWLSSQLHVALGTQLGTQLRSQLGPLWSQRQVGPQLDSQLESRLGPLWSQRQLGTQLNEWLDTQLSSQLYSQLGTQLSTRLREQLGTQLKGVHWPWWRYAWLTRWLFVAALDGIDPPEEDVLTLARSYRAFCTPALTIPLTGVVVVCGQYSSLNRNAAGGLHCTDGPAWAWPDGTAVYALEGIRVPEWVVTAPEAQRILTDLDNTEQRRVAFAHLGWDRVVSDLGLTPIDTHPDPHVGTLYDLPKEAAPGPARLLVARNASPHTDGTWQTYGLLCSPDAETAQQAQASLAGLRLADWLALDGAA